MRFPWARGQDVRAAALTAARPGSISRASQHDLPGSVCGPDRGAGGLGPPRPGQPPSGDGDAERRNRTSRPRASSTGIVGLDERPAKAGARRPGHGRPGRRRRRRRWVLSNPPGRSTLMERRADLAPIESRATTPGLGRTTAVKSAVWWSIRSSAPQACGRIRACGRLGPCQPRNAAARPWAICTAVADAASRPWIRQPVLPGREPGGVGPGSARREPDNGTHGGPPSA